MATDVLRTEEVLSNYRRKSSTPGFDIKKFSLLDLPHVKDWKYWVLVENEFPYDKISVRHSLLVPRRHFTEDENMSSDERQELFFIKAEFKMSKEFDAILENIKHNRTVPDIYHIHCFKFKFRTPVSDLQ